MTDSLHVSKSSVECFRECEQQYYYRYVRKLRPLYEDRVDLDRGSIIHSYLEAFYGAKLADQNGDPQRAHFFALLHTVREWRPKCRQWVALALDAGDEALALEWSELLAVCLRICRRYFRVRGRLDWDRFDVLLVEEPIDVWLTKAHDVRSEGRVDLVARDRQTNDVILFEHKTTKSPPGEGVRLRDLQTLLYKCKLAMAPWKLTVTRVLWNYLRTVEPKQPKYNKPAKDGTTPVSVAECETTWELYYEAVKAGGGDPDDDRYFEMKQRLTAGEGAEKERFFQRYEQPILASPATLMRDYIRTAKDIATRHKAWDAGTRIPVRDPGRLCEWCSYQMLCTAAILAGNENAAEEIIELRFTVPEN